MTGATAPGDREQQVETMMALARGFVVEAIGKGFHPAAVGVALVASGTLAIKLGTDEATATLAIGHLHGRMRLQNLAQTGEPH